MGTSGNWLKSLIPLKKSSTTHHSEAKCKKKWRLWRSSSEGFVSSSSKGLKRVHMEGSEPSDSPFSAVDDSFAVAMATVARAAPRDFMAVKREWAAIRIQTAFRRLLAKRAFRALRAVVRIQAIFRGRQVRKQAAVTLRCMQALVRVQARARARNVRISVEGQAVQRFIDECQNQDDPIKQAEKGWCDSPGTVDEVRAKLQTRQKGAIKRERAIAYSLSQQPSRSSASPSRRTNKLAFSLKHQNASNMSPGWSWLDRWMAAKPWDGRLMEEIHTEKAEALFCRKSTDNITGFCPCKCDQVKVSKNNITKRILAKPSLVSKVAHLSSTPSSDSSYDGSSESTSSTSRIPMSSNTIVVDEEEESCNQKPNYMNLTESTKAKQKGCRHCSYAVQRYMVEDHFHSMSMTPSSADTKSSAGSNPLFNSYKDLHPPSTPSRQDEIKHGWN